MKKCLTMLTGKAVRCKPPDPSDWMAALNRSLSVRRPKGRNNQRLARLYNDSVIALDVLYEAASQGSSACEEALRDLADRLVRAAGNTRRLLDAAPKPRQ